MNRDAVADIFQRIGRAKAGSREKEPGAGPSAKTVKQHNETPVLVHDPTSESATEAKEAGVYICTECGAAMRPAMYMLGGIFAADDGTTVQAGHAGQKHIGNLYCCPMCGSLKVKIDTAGNKEERK